MIGRLWKGYKDLMRSLNGMGISVDSQNAIFEVTAAIVHLGNITFTQTAQDGSEVEDAHALKNAAKFFGNIDAKQLSKCLTTKQLKIGPEITTKLLTTRAAEGTKS